MSLPKNKLIFLFCLLMSLPVTSSFAERTDREKPIKMEADRVTVDDTNQVSTFEGKVNLQQGTLLIEASKILVKQDIKGYSQVTATGQLAHFRQKRDIVNEYAEGYGERMEYDSLAETVNIFGQARVKREGDDVRGEHIIYSTKTGIFQVFGSINQAPEKTDPGRVTVIIQPKPKATETPPSAPTSPVPPTPKQPQ